MAESHYTSVMVWKNDKLRIIEISKENKIPISHVIHNLLDLFQKGSKS